MTNAQIDARLREIAAQFGNLKCDQAAIAMKRFLKRQGVNGVHLKIRAKGQPRLGLIMSYRLMNATVPISRNSNHEGIEFNGLVYDNLGPPLSRPAWLISMDYYDLVTRRVSQEFVVTEENF